MGQNIDLVDRLHRMVRCEFISDLKGPQWKQALLHAIGNISAEDYTFTQWSSALSYCWEEDVQISSKADLRAFLAEKSAPPSHT